MTLEAAKRGGVGNDMVDEVIMGNVLQAGLDQNPARQATVQLGVSGLTGDAARTVLAELCGSFSYAVDCATLDPKGKMLTIEPAAYRHFEGTDISEQEQVKRIFEGNEGIFTLRPTFSGERYLEMVYVIVLK